MNLKDAPEAVKQAMTQMGDYGPGCSTRARDPHSLDQAIAFLKNPPSTGEMFEIYGHGGMNRYYVRPDGNVLFSTYHGTVKTEQARILGFDIR